MRCVSIHPCIFVAVACTLLGDHVRTAISIAHQCFIMPDRRAIAVVDGLDVDAKSSSSAKSQFSLSVVNVDGSVSTEGLTAATLAGRIMDGELQCAVTGKGFNRYATGD